jgi:hypothetical protein
MAVANVFVFGTTTYILGFIGFTVELCKIEFISLWNSKVSSMIGIILGDTIDPISND